MWTADQKAAIEARGNVIVSAAAGAGKTSVLTERVLRLVSEGIPIDRMLILTFTRAAAGEMKARIAARLEAAAAAEEDDAKRAFLRAQSHLLPGANISTMHAFCSKVVFRHFFCVGLAPSARTLDETESAVLFREVREKTLSELALNDPAAYRLLLGAFGGENALCDALTRLFAFLSAEPDPDAWLATAEATLTDRAAFDALLVAEMADDRRALSLAVEELSFARDLLPPSCGKALSLLDTLLTHARGALLQAERDRYAQALSGIPIDGRLSFPKDLSPADTAPVKEAKSAFNKCVREQIERYSISPDELFSSQRDGAEPIHALFGFLQAFRAAYAEEKRQRAAVDFNDLEHMTIEILKDDRIAAEYRERFSTVIVDEYQDSNRVQEAILSRICRTDNLFFVGDVKQSIYRFRNAEPGLFLEKCRTFTGARGTRIDLKTNFRSGGAVIDAVNRVFETLMREPIAAIAYDDAARLFRGSPEAGGTVEFHVIEKHAETDEDSIAEAEAEARLIAAHLLRRKEAPIFDAKTGGQRPPEFGDFAILLRSKTHAAVFAQTLAFAGIPCYAQLSGGYFEAIEVQVLLNVLRVLDNRRQDIPLLSVMRSPLFRFTDEELIALRVQQKKGALLDCLLSQREQNDHVDALLTQLEQWRVLSRRAPMEELLDTILTATQYREHMGALPGGAQRAQNLDALCERARAFDASGAGGIHGFLRFMDDAAKATDLGASQTVTANVVRIMTIHKSKGLEFPLVYLANLGRRFNRKDESNPLLLHESLGVGLQYLDANGIKRRTYARRLIKSRIADAAWQEELRVLYVGMTRAKSELFLFGCTGNAEQTIASLPLPTLGNLRAAGNDLRLLLLTLNGYLAPILHDKSEASGLFEQLKRPILPPAEPGQVQRLTEHLSWQYPHPSAHPFLQKTSVTALDKAVLEPFEPAAFDRADGAKELGSLTHMLLERLPLSLTAESELDMLAASIGVPQDRLDALRRFLRSPLYERMLASDRIEREWAFVRPVPACVLYDTEQTESVLLQGVIDACFTENGGWVLLDYKTDRVIGDPAVHAERHRKQVMLYADALESLTGLSVREAYVVLLHAGVAVNLK